MNDETERITRRGSILRAGGLLAALAVGGCADDGDGEQAATTAGSGPAGVESGDVKCVLTPEQTEGPFYVDGAKLRRDITEGRPGTPLALELEVVSASACKPIANVAVDIWHCDALGEYSGVNGGSGTFMRGVQRTDSKGVARFDTVYPGWYSGRAVHIHVKVHAGGNVVHTGQLYFPDEVTAGAYDAPPYDSRPGPEVANDEDAIFVNGGSKSMLTVKKSDDGYTGSIRMGVQTA
jgi:protocatechuate 3,4-dioxygenase beta subunit